MARRTMYLLDVERPWKKVLEAECEVLSGPKTTWAKPVGRDRRFRAGTSAFFSAEVATGRRTERLEKMVADYWVKNQKPDMWAQAKRALDLVKLNVPR